MLKSSNIGMFGNFICHSFLIVVTVDIMCVHVEGKGLSFYGLLVVVGSV